MRPTSDRLRETLFNVLGIGVRNARFLDLCAGSGAVGIEALSRGARHAVFVDSSRRACSVIESNLKSLGLTDQATVVCRDIVPAFKQLAALARPFDFVFFDPPYESGLYSAVLDALSQSGLLAGNASVVVEHRARAVLLPEYGSLHLVRELVQGDSALAFYRADSEKPDPNSLADLSADML